jgi:hypothetical protein
MDVSVIIVNYKVPGLVCDAVESVLNNTSSLHYEILIADNSPDDGLEKLLSDRFGSQVQYFPMIENTGFGRANNEALREASGRNILLLNPDTLIMGNTIKVLSDYLDNHPDTGMAGGNLYDNRMNPVFSYRCFLPSVFWELNDLFSSLPEKILKGRNATFNHTDKVMQVAYLTAAAIMIPRRVIIETNGFDPSFFLYFEDTDLAFSIRNKGYKVRSIPQTKIIHLGGRSFVDKNIRTERYLRGKLLYYRKNLKKISRFFALSVFKITIFSRIVAFRFIFNKSKLDEWKTTRIIFSGILKADNLLKI